MKNILENALAKAMNYEQYNLLFTQLSAEGRTTGESTQEKIDYTKLNFSRTKRLDKTAVIDESNAEIFRVLDKPQTWLVLSEPWCGDAAQTLPYLNKIAQLSEKIELKIVLRDENSELMDLFLTNGSRTIPKIVILNEDLEVTGTWGPRSEAATAEVESFRGEDGKLDPAFKEHLQMWYNQNKGKAIISELADSVNELV